jgi:hypothetical protein
MQGTLMNTHSSPTSLISPPRREQLRTELLATVDSLYRRRADLVAEAAIDDYVALHWLEWSGGGLRLTLTGTNVCDQMRAGMK